MYYKIIGIFLLLISFSQQGIFSGYKWQSSSPEAQGMSGEKLDAMKDILAEKDTKALLIIRNDKIVYEWYSPEHGQNKRHYTASLVKAIVGGTSLMLALNDSLISVDDFACKYIPQWKNRPQKSKITIRHLATHSSGIENAEQDGMPHMEIPGWKGDFWRKDPDPFTIARDKAPVIFPPGSKYDYSNPGMGMLAYAVTESIKDAPQSNILELLRERIMRPIGVEDNEWSIGYGRGYEVDGLNLYANWGGGGYTARAVACVGRLMIHKGNWDGKQLVEPEWIDECVRYAETPLPEESEDNPSPGSGLCWWTNFNGIWKEVPRDSYAGAGAGNQILLVIPSLDLVVVRNGAQIGDTFWGGVEKYLFNPLIDSIVDSEPVYHNGAVIKGAVIAPQSSITIKARGSDNWAITWADDGNQYTAYGDGWGFEPKVEKKLSLGLVKIIGNPSNFSGVNIRSATGEQLGDGKSGMKTSGMLMVDNVLYMWVRNANNNGEQSQLAWSDDHALTWQWSDWRFEELGYCCFLNFGKNYAGARDNYVYSYSPNIPHAYNETDEVVLARVPKDKIKDKDAYEFFQGFSEDRSSLWTPYISRRKAVFTLKGGCNRLDVVYNSPLKRYIMTMRSRAEAGGLNQFSIYEALEPWGPWSQVYYYEPLTDVRGWPGEAQHFPSKWISSDGKTLYMVLAAYDAFSVQKVTLVLDSGYSK
ncbi:serine hydrolase [candidate division KSB1 bacterium]